MSKQIELVWGKPYEVFDYYGIWLADKHFIGIAIWRSV